MHQANELEKQAAAQAIRAAGKALWHGTKATGRGINTAANKFSRAIDPYHHISRAADKRIAAGTAGKGWHRAKRVSDFMQRGDVQLAGFGTMMAGMAGVPGMDAVSSVFMPGWTALASAPSAIQSARLATGKYDGRIKQDAQEGAREAGAHFIAGMYNDPRVLQERDGFRSFLSEVNPAANIGAYDPAEYQARMRKPTSFYENFTTNAQGFVDHKLDQEIGRGLYGGGIKSAAFNPSAVWNGVKSVGGKAFNGAGSLMTLGFAGGSVYGIGNAMFGDKPYDEAATRQKGYDAAAYKINNTVNSMPAWKRTLAGFDPSLAVSELEKQLPGTTAKFEGLIGGKMPQGIISQSIGRFQRGAPQEYFVYDDDGNKRPYTTA